MIAEQKGMVSQKDWNLDATESMKSQQNTLKRQQTEKNEKVSNMEADIRKSEF